MTAAIVRGPTPTANASASPYRAEPLAVQRGRSEHSVVLFDAFGDYVDERDVQLARLIGYDEPETSRWWSMAQRRRPSNVPAGARWNEQLKRWEAGTARSGKRIGTWSFWDPDGTLRTERTWDEQGRVHGRHLAFHSDGTPSYDGLSEHGKLLRITHHAAASGKDRFDPKLPFAVDRTVVKAEYVPAARGWEWRLYDQAGDRVDDEGNPLGRSSAIDAQLLALQTRSRSPAGETFERAIARANRWYGDLIALRGKAVKAAYGRRSEAVWSVGKPATRVQLAALERWSGGALPPSYRRFVSELGCIKFVDRVETVQVARIRSVSERYTAASFADAFASERRLDGRPWGRAKQDVVVGFRERELADPPFLQIAPDSEGGHLLVLHARDRRGEAPVVRHYADDGTTDVSLVARSFDGWVSARVDHMIAELTSQFA